MHRAGLACVLAFALAACGRRSADPAELTAEDRAALAQHSPLPPLPPDPTNALADDPRAAALGQMLFFDEALSGSRTISCRTCHAGPALDDAGKHVSVGVRPGTRNSPPVLDSAFYTWNNWGGRFDTPWALALGAIEKPEVMGGTRAAVVEVVRAKYRAEAEALVGPLDALAPDELFVTAGKAIAAYMRLLVARAAPFDRWIAGDETAVSAAAKRGAKLFLAHCRSCHAGPHFSDNQFHALGMAQFGDGVPETDLGRYTDVADFNAKPFRSRAPVPRSEDMRGQFRTPTLRNVAVTAPYMHAGQLATLANVVAFYNAGGGSVAGVTKDPAMVRLGLSPAQQADLVAFLETLTDTAVPPALLVDTAR